MSRNRRHTTTKKTVAIVGMAKTSRHKAPWNDKSKEIWVLNESPVHNYIKRFDRLFCLHPRWDQLRSENFNDPLHPQWLRNEPWTENDIREAEELYTYKDCYYGPEGTQCPLEVGKPRRSEDFPIYVLDAKQFPDVPGATTYPLHQVWDWLDSEYSMDRFRLKDQHYIFKYNTSSGTYMIMLAMYEGFERIELFGFEMNSQEEYGYQKPAMEFWLGVALGRGIEVYLPPGCALLGERERMYGYEKVPGFTKMHCEIFMNEVRMAREQAIAELNHVNGQKANIMGALKEANERGDAERAKNLQAVVAETAQKEINAIAKMNAFNGELHAYQRIHAQLTAQRSDDNLAQPIVPAAYKVKE